MIHLKRKGLIEQITGQLKMKKGQDVRTQVVKAILL